MSNKAPVQRRMHLPRVVNEHNYRRHVVLPLAVLTTTALVATGIVHEVDKNSDHSISYLKKDKQVTRTVGDREGPSTLISEVDGNNLDPQTTQDLTTYILRQAQGHDKAGNPILELGQPVNVPDVHTP